MNVTSLLTTLRFKLDVNEVSDYQIVQALNYVMREINAQLAGVTSSLITKTATLTLTGNAAPLPDDFETMIIVTDKTLVPIDADLDAYTYKIVGNTIMAQGETITIYYKKSFPEYDYDGAITPTTIDLPPSFSNMIIDNIVLIIGGQATTVQAQVIKLIANRDGKKRTQNLVFNL